MSIREKRLRNELACMEALCQRSSFVSFQTKEEPPDEYLVRFTCTGMETPNKTRSEHLVSIYLSAEFPRKPPQVRFFTPIFHPNIKAPIQDGYVQDVIQKVLDNATDDQERQEFMEKLGQDRDLWEARICLDTLSLNWSPSITLDMICIELGEMIQYKRHNPGHPLNGQAAAWADANKERLPVDTRSFCDLEDLNRIRILEESPVQDIESLINIL